MARITNQNKETIKKHVDIIELAREYFDLKPGRNGSRYYIQKPKGYVGDGMGDFDSVTLYPETNTFYRRSTGVGGDVITFVLETHLEGIEKYIDACNFLMNRIDPNFSVEISTKKREQKKMPLVETHKSLLAQLQLNDQLELDKDTKYIWAYLVRNREIDKDIVNEGISRGYIKPIIYKNKMRSVAFFGYSELGSICAVCERGINFGSSFKRNFENCDYDRGWVWYPKDEKGNKIIPDKSTMIICESYIDMLSYMTLIKETDPNWRNYVYQSLASASNYPTAIKTIDRFNPGTVIIATDNDKAGHICGDKIFSYIQDNNLDITFKVSLAEAGDWNEQLKVINSLKGNITQRIESSSKNITPIKQSVEKIHTDIQER